MVTAQHCLNILSTGLELVPATNASLATMQGYYPTWNHSPLKERNEQGCLLQCLNCPMFAVRLWITKFLSLTNRKSSVHLHALYSPRTALRTFTPRRDQLVMCGQYTLLFVMGDKGFVKRADSKKEGLCFANKFILEYARSCNRLKGLWSKSIFIFYAKLHIWPEKIYVFIPLRPTASETVKAFSLWKWMTNLSNLANFISLNEINLWP
jgi:hypothetical protein